MLPIGVGPRWTSNGGDTSSGGRGGNLSHQIRDQTKRVGLTIGRKRLLAHCTSNDNDTASSTRSNSDDDSNDARLLFRRGDDDGGGDTNAAGANNYFLETPTPYAAISFLNDYVVLAADEKGQIDAVRLPTRRGEGRGQRRRRGTLAANCLGEPLDLLPKSQISLFPFLNGDAFAVGYPGGEVRIYSTEHDATWGAAAAATDIGSPTGAATCTSTSSSNHRPSFLHCAVREGGPRRKYERLDYRQYGAVQGGQSLREMLVSQSLGRQYLPEILDWDVGQYPPYRSIDAKLTANPNLMEEMGMVENSAAYKLYAFREVGAGGSLLTAYADPYLDCYSLRMMDGRTMSQNSSTSTAEAQQKTQICIDLKPLNTRAGGGQYSGEDISSLAFVGDNALATSHVSRVENKCDIMNVIKFWDLRMISSAKPKPATSAVVASFPFDDCYGVEALREVVMSGTYCYDPVALIVDPLDTDQIPSSGFAVTRLTGSVGTGLLSISTQVLTGCGPTGVEINRLEPNKYSEVLVDSNRFHILHKTQKISADGDSQRKPAFTPDLDFMAAFQKTDEYDCDPIVSLFDLSNRASEDGTLQKKRSYEDMKKGATRDGCNMVGQINAAVNDSYGSISDIECIALNRHGTALCCGTADGDLFLWE